MDCYIFVYKWICVLVAYLNHEGEVCEGGGVDGSSGTGPHDERDLRHDS